MQIQTLRRVLVLLAALCILGCDNPDVPRPTDAGFIDWLTGQVVTSEKGIIVDSKWRIEPKEVSDFKVLKLTQNAKDGVYAATVSFRATAHGKGIEVREAVIRYERAKEPNELKYVDFTPITVSQVGG